MELQTKEEVHVLCLFKDLEPALIFQEFVYDRLPNIKNKPEIFGNQIIYNENDEIVGYEEKLLLNSADITIDEAFYKVKELGGQFIPAHIDKDTYSIISNLGFMPDYLNITTIEYSKLDKVNKLIKNKILKDSYRLIKNSDAHNLGQISERENYIKATQLKCFINKTSTGWLFHFYSS
ncbi:phosphoesterase [Caloramator sp. mosi_1]|uniref:phosphoesterase n=1 Tax=Caloramator sp. mosi_1 TaxID=3023090 RepID=UPI0023620884|nr:phosphoesterase [Caloramator sp. mosi_1]WDC84842.1 phosphoesterase [Caloramator sp. mosi_1]